MTACAAKVVIVVSKAKSLNSNVDVTKITHHAKVQVAFDTITDYDKSNLIDGKDIVVSRAAAKASTHLAAV